jgi:hypothetical protein
MLVLQQAQAQIEDASLESSHEERKGILVSLLAGSHQLCVILLGRFRNKVWACSFPAV